MKAGSNANGRTTPERRNTSNGSLRRQSPGGAENLSRSSSTGLSSRKTSSSLFGSMLSNGASSILKHAKGSSRSFDGGSRSLERSKVYSSGIGIAVSLNKNNDSSRSNETDSMSKGSPDGKSTENEKSDNSDYVSGLLYDMLQKEVISLRKACHEKDQSLKDKDDAIEVQKRKVKVFFFFLAIYSGLMHTPPPPSSQYIYIAILSFLSLIILKFYQMLARKVDTLNKAMEVEAKKMRREIATMEKEVAALRVDKEHELRTRRLTTSKGSLNSSQVLPGR